MSRQPYDVAIVGAGPTGLTLANLLGQQGLSVLLIERNVATVTEPRAVSIDDESLRTMQAAGLIDRVLPHIVPGYGSRYLSASGACFLQVLPTGKPYGFPRRNAFRQPVLEQQLRDGLARYSAVDARFGVHLSDFTQDPEGVALLLERNGEQDRCRALYLIGCDGAGSLVRKKLGLVLEGATSPERWLIVDLAQSPAARDTVVFCDVSRPCIALPGPDETRRFEFKLFAHETDADVLRPDNVRDLLQSRGVAPGSQIVRQTVYTFHARIVNRWSDGRVYLAGDAAHLTPPFAGQGMNSGIRDAHNIAWKLASVVREELPPVLLESYQTERRAHVAAMIDLALTMGRIMGPASRLSGWATQSVFRLAALWPWLRIYLSEMRYKPKPSFKAGFLIPGGGHLVGRLLPQPVVRTFSGEELLLDEALPPGFVLLGINLSAATLNEQLSAFDFGRIAVKPIALAGLTARCEAGAFVIQDQLDPSLEAASGSLLLIRPDRYVMASFEPRESKKVAPQIARLFCDVESKRQPVGSTWAIAEGWAR